MKAIAFVELSFASDTVQPDEACNLDFLFAWMFVQQRSKK